VLGKVYIVIVNWNGWRDTIECLESVLRNDYPAFQVIVCDNDSADGSLDRIRDWAAGRLSASARDGHPLRHLTAPPVPKPIPFVEYDREPAEAGGDVAAADVPLILIRTAGNLGFAGGCNVGLRHALARADFDYAWLLNNDTVIAPDALTALVARMRERPDAGQCGSRLLFYDAPREVQAYGGATYNRWLAWSRHVGAFCPADRPVDVSRIERRLDYVVGASLLVSRSFLLDVGLLSEEYFLYGEEIDWATRGKGRYALAYAHRSIVYHKEGCSTGSSSSPAEKGPLADLYSVRNRLRFTRAYHPLALPTVYLALAIAVLNRLRRRQPERARDILRIMFSSKTYALANDLRAGAGLVPGAPRPRASA
jgi:GT2 family glycosyltransferase